MRKARRGDIQAFLHLVEGYESVVLSLILMTTRSEPEVEVLYESTFLQLYDKVRSARQIDSAELVAYRIAATLCTEYERSGGAHRNLPERADKIGKERFKRSPEFPRSRAADARPNDVRDPHAAFDVLTIRERLVLVLKHYHGLSLRSIAEIFEATETCVRAVFIRALCKLRKALCNTRRNGYGARRESLEL